MGEAGPEFTAGEAAAVAEQRKALAGVPYYHGVLPKEVAERVLHKDGEFLLRIKDERASKSFILDVRWEGPVRHYQVFVVNGLFYVIKDKAHGSIKELMDYHWRMAHPLPSKAATPVRLGLAVARRRWELKSSAIRMDKYVANGGFGEVWKGLWKSRRGHVMEVAVKTCKEKTVAGRAAFEKEALFQLRFNHKNVVRTLGAVITGQPMSVVQEWLERGCLPDFLEKEKEKVSVARLKSCCLDVGRGLEYLEGLHCIHRDVCARNCLVSIKGDVKISGFHYAKSVHKYKMLVGKVGIKWMAPESMKDGVFTSKSDVWAFGVLMWEVFSRGKDPFPNLCPNAIKRKVIVEGFKLPPPPGTPPGFVAAMEQCWKREPGQRPSFALLLPTLPSFNPGLRRSSSGLLPPLQQRDSGETITTTRGPSGPDVTTQGSGGERTIRGDSTKDKVPAAK